LVWRFTRIPTQSRRQAPIMGIAGLVLRPILPRRTVLIPVQGVRDESPTCSLRMVASPGHARAVSPLGIHHTPPRPRGAGRRPEPGGWGQRGGNHEFRRPTGRGRAPSRFPTPQSDFPPRSTARGEPGEIGHFPAYSLSLLPMNSPARLSGAKDAKGAYRPATELRVLRLLRARDRRSRQRTSS